MTDILKSNDRLIPLDQLPPELQEKIKKYAVLDIYKDKAKKEIKPRATKILGARR